MWILLLLFGIVAALFLVIFINLELNSLRKKVDNLIVDIKKHYGIE